VYCIATAASRILRAHREGKSMYTRRGALAAAAIGLLGGIVAVKSLAADEYVRLESLDKRFDALIAPGTAAEMIADGLEWSEGPLWETRTSTLYFSDVKKNVIWRWSRATGAQKYLEPSGYTGATPYPGIEPGSNGLTFDLAGRLTICQHGDRRISKLGDDRKFIPVATGFEGNKFNSPNDLVYDRDGALYFTDPPFGLPQTFTDPTKELPFNAVFRVSPEGKVTPVAKDLEAPNGLGFSPDYQTLYVANARGSLPIWKAYPVNADGSLGEGRVFADSSQYYKPGEGVPDGLKIDVHGNVFATGPGGVLVYAPDGTLLGRILTGVPTSNVAFGEDGSTLFITANHRVLRLPTRTKGMPLPAAK
jgi:gluconolactonase